MSIFKRKLKNGYSWRVVIRNNKHPTVCETFERKQAAEDWERSVKQQIKLGKYKFGRPSQNNLFSDLVDSYIRDGVLDHHKSCKPNFTGVPEGSCRFCTTS